MKGNKKRNHHTLRNKFYPKRRVLILLSLVIVIVNAIVLLIFFMLIESHDYKVAYASTSGTDPNFYGINWHPMWINSGGQDAEMDIMQQAGLKTVRIDAEWYFMEPSQGSYHPTYLARMDNAVNGLLARGMQPLIVVTSTPQWVTGAPSTDPDGMHEPPIRSVIASNCNSTQTICSKYNHVSNYDNFLSFLMKRYLGKVHSYEIWNEPDGQWAWRTTEDAYPQDDIDRGTDYTTLLKSAYTTAKSIDSTVTILGGVLSNTLQPQEYMLKSMYTNGAKNYFDVYSQHYYCDPPNDNWCNTSRSVYDPDTLANNFTNNMYPILQANGDGSKPVWITETGYNTGPGGISESLQAQYLTESYAKAKKLPNVARLYWYDMEESNTGSDSQSYYGILAADLYNANSMPIGWRSKLAYSALQNLAGATIPTSLPTLKPTATPNSKNTTLTIDLGLQGIGKGGDSANPNSQENMNPINPTRTVTAYIYNLQNQLILTQNGIITYAASSGRFKGEIDLGTNFATGEYTVKIKTDKYLRELFPGIQSINANTTTHLPAVTLEVGDINGDNQINIIDYNIFIGCYSDLLPATNCNTTNNTLSDLNDDGHVNEFDYNLFLRELTNILGQ